MRIDSIDRQILTILQSDARTSNAEIGRQVGMAPSGVLERIRKLEAGGVLRGFTTKLDPKALGHGLLAYVMVRSDERISDESTGKALAKLPEVQEAHHIAGEDCYLVKVRCADPDALGKLLRHEFGGIPTVLSTRTTIVLDTLKETAELELGPSEESEDD